MPVKGQIVSTKPHELMTYYQKCCHQSVVFQT